MKKLFLLAIAIIGMQTYLKSACEKEYELGLKERQELFFNKVGVLLKGNPLTSCTNICYKEEKTVQMVKGCFQKCYEKHTPATVNWKKCVVLDQMRAAQEIKK